jgi:polar amino acid transport system substrate-binding protein
MDSKTNELRGAGIEFTKAILKEMGYNPEFIVLPISRLFSDLQSGSIDMAGEFMKTPEREVFAYYSDSPVLILKPSLFFLSENRLSKITSINDLKGMTIGYISSSPIPKFLDNPEIVKFEFISSENWLELNYRKLLSGRIDAILDQNSYSGIAEAKKTGNQNKVKVLELPVEGVNAYMLFSKKSKIGSNLQSSYNKAFSTGKYNYSKFLEAETE